jgi:RimJ/RimL family protein N-acetyltransferase
VTQGELATDLPELVLRELSSPDADTYYALLDRNRDHFRRFGDYTEEINATREWVASYFDDPPDGNTRFGIWLRGQLIGRVDLNPVDPPRYGIGYWLSGASTGHGYATVACRAAIDYGRDVLGATDVFAGVTVGNNKSIAVLIRLGFVLVAQFDSYDRYHLALGGSQ